MQKNNGTHSNLAPTSHPSKALHANSAMVLAALPFFSDPAAFSLLIFGVIVVVVTIGTLVYFIMIKNKK